MDFTNSNAVQLSQLHMCWTPVGGWPEESEQNEGFAATVRSFFCELVSFFTSCLGRRKARAGYAAEVPQQPLVINKNNGPLDINALVPKRPTRQRPENSAEWTPMSLDTPSDVDAGAAQVTGLDEYLQAVVLQEARQAWVEECQMRWSGEIREPLERVFGGEEEEGEMEEHEVASNNTSFYNEQGSVTLSDRLLGGGKVRYGTMGSSASYGREVRRVDSAQGSNGSF